MTTKDSAIRIPKPYQYFMKLYEGIDINMKTNASCDVQDDEEVVIVAEEDDVTLTEDEIGIFSRIPPLMKNWVLNDFRQICRLCRGM